MVTFTRLLWMMIAALALRTVQCSLECENNSKEHDFPPSVFHVQLNKSFVESYEEIFVIGDIHGCYDELQLLLEKANATGDNVLKLLTGDFLRKGPKSIETLKYVRNTPHILSVRGNNDEKVLIRHKMAKTSDYKLLPMDFFIRHLTEDDLSFLKELPYTIRIPSLNILVVHGGLQPTLPIPKNTPFDMMNVRNFVYTQRCPGWYSPQQNSKNGGEPWATKWRGPEHVVFGHDHKRQLQFHPFATGLDTSCTYGHYLTGLFVMGPRTGTITQQMALKKYFSHHDEKVDDSSPPVDFADN